MNKMLKNMEEVGKKFEIKFNPTKSILFDVWFIKKRDERRNQYV